MEKGDFTRCLVQWIKAGRLTYIELVGLRVAGGSVGFLTQAPVKFSTRRSMYYTNKSRRGIDRAKRSGGRLPPCRLEV